jgi:hypothetical protein
MKKLIILLFTVFLSVGSLSAQSTDLKKLIQQASQGDAFAQFRLGLRYAQGQGVPQDDVQAVKWYRLAADQGLVVAQTNLGARYDNGQEAASQPVENKSTTDTNTGFQGYISRLEEYERRRNTYIPQERWWSPLSDEKRQEIFSELVKEGRQRKYINELSDSVNKKLDKESSVIGRIFEFILGAAVIGGFIGLLISLFGDRSDTKEAALTGAGFGAMASVGCLWEVFKLVLGFMAVMWILSFIFGN